MVLTMKKNILALNDEITHTKNEVSRLRRQLTEREVTLKTSKKKYEEFKEATEVEIAS